MNEAKNVQTPEELLAEKLHLKGSEKLSTLMFSLMWYCDNNCDDSQMVPQTLVYGSYKPATIKGLRRRGLLVAVDDQFYCGWVKGDPAKCYWEWIAMTEETPEVEEVETEPVTEETPEVEPVAESNVTGKDIASLFKTVGHKNSFSWGNGEYWVDKPFERGGKWVKRNGYNMVIRNGVLFVWGKNWEEDGAVELPLPVDKTLNIETSIEKSTAKLFNQIGKTEVEFSVSADGQYLVVTELYEGSKIVNRLQIRPLFYFSGNVDDIAGEKPNESCVTRLETSDDINVGDVVSVKGQEMIVTKILVIEDSTWFKCMDEFDGFSNYYDREDLELVVEETPEVETELVVEETPEVETEPVTEETPEVKPVAESTISMQGGGLPPSPAAPEEAPVLEEVYAIKPAEQRLNEILGFTGEARLTKGMLLTMVSIDYHRNCEYAQEYFIDGEWSLLNPEAINGLKSRGLLTKVGDLYRCAWNQYDPRKCHYDFFEESKS